MKKVVAAEQVKDPTVLFKLRYYLSVESRDGNNSAVRIAASVKELAPAIQALKERFELYVNSGKPQPVENEYYALRHACLLYIQKSLESVKEAECPPKFVVGEEGSVKVDTVKIRAAIGILQQVEGTEQLRGVLGGMV